MESQRAAKQSLRAQTRAKILQIPEERRQTLSRRIAEFITATKIWEETTALLSFRSMRGEVNTRPIFKAALREKKIACAPRMKNKSEIVFHQCLSLQRGWKRHPFGVFEPQEENPVIDPLRREGPVLIITPGVVFDYSGNRIGFGAGYYDRFLTPIHRRRETEAGKIAIIAAAFSIQVVKELPVTKMDVPVDGIVTEKGFLPASGTGEYIQSPAKVPLLFR